MRPESSACVVSYCEQVKVIVVAVVTGVAQAGVARSGVRSKRSKKEGRGKGGEQNSDLTE